MKKTWAVILLTVFLVGNVFLPSAEAAAIKLGSDRLVGEEQYRKLIVGKKVGLVTNQTGVNSAGQHIMDVLYSDPEVQLNALYGPEHGIDGKAKAGAYVASYTHPDYKIPVYSLYGETRMPTEKMLENIDVLVFDIQDIGSRTYTYMSTLNYCMVAAKKYGKQVVVLDRPNPVGGVIVEGPVLEDKYKTFVGVDNLPMAHGMTAGELAQFYNRNIGADLKVVPMSGYRRDMVWQDTGLKFIGTSPVISDIDAMFGYMATGLGEGTGIYQASNFKWIGGKGIDPQKFANLLNGANLPGVTYQPEYINGVGGVRLKITDYHKFNPAKSGFYALAYAHSLTNYKVPKSGSTIVMFDKIMGTDKIGTYLEQGLSPQQIEAKYKAGLDAFKAVRKKYLIYPETAQSNGVKIILNGQSLAFDTAPYIDKNSRVLVPLRVISEGLGAVVNWNEKTKSITLSKNSINSFLVVGSKTILVNGKEMSMDTAPILKEGRTMVPLRFVAENFKSTVNWEAATKTVYITENKE